MAGTLTISTLSDGTNSTSSTNCIQGAAKAWVNFIGASATIRASYNVSSVTRNATGNYTVNMTNAMVDTNYAPICQSFYSDDNLIQGSGRPNTTSNFLIKTPDNSGAYMVINSFYDHPYVFAAVFR
jgi:hypothetical protein